MNNDAHNQLEGQFAQLQTVAMDHGMRLRSLEVAEVVAMSSVPHNLLSATHTDTSPASPPMRGSIVVADAIPVWSELPIGANQTYLRSDGIDPSWSVIQVGDLPNLGGVPNLTYSTVNAVGVATTYIKTDATIDIFDVGLPSTLRPDDVALPGAIAHAARRDHQHAIVCAIAGTIQPDDVAAEGSATSFARSDHQHAILCAVAGTIVPDAVASEGVALSFARSDHQHAIVCNVAGTIQPDDVAQEGSSTWFARSDHQHAIVCNVAVDIGNVNAEGSSTWFSRSDHVHNHPAGLGTDLHHIALIGLEDTATTAVGPAADDRIQLRSTSAALSIVSDAGNNRINFTANLTGLTHNLLSATHTDTLTAGVSRGSIIVGNSTPRWSELVAPGAAGYALVSTATTLVWDQAPTWTGLHTFWAGWTLSGGAGDLDGWNLVVDTDGDSYIHAIGDDHLQIVCATVAGQLDVVIVAGADFSFTQNSFNVVSGSHITMSDNTWIGLAAAAGRIVFDNQATDEINFEACRVGVNESTPEVRVEVNGRGRFLDQLESGPVTGKGIEIFCASSVGYLYAYNRDTASWLNMRLGKNIYLSGANGCMGVNEGTPEVHLEVNGRGRFLSQSESAPTTGTGVDILYSSVDATGYVLAFDRVAVAYKDLRLGQNIYLSGANGFLGVNRAAPTYQLDVYENKASGWVASFDQDNSTGYVARFVTDSVTAGDPIIACYNPATHIFKVDAVGRVGIRQSGTGDPAYPLDVYSNESANYVAVFDQDHASGYGVRINVDGTGTATAFLVMQGASQLFRVQQNGLCGINMSTPDSMLEIAGSNSSNLGFATVNTSLYAHDFTLSYTVTYYAVEGTAEELGTASGTSKRVGVHGTLINAANTGYFVGGGLGVQDAVKDIAAGVWGEKSTSLTPTGYYSVAGFFGGPVKIFNSYLEMDEITSPGAGDADEARQYVYDNGGQQELRVVFGNGTVKTITTDV